MAEWQTPETVAFWITIVFLIILCLGIAIVFFIRVHLKRMLTAQEKLNTEKLIHQEELLRTSVTIQERERKRIASDLHDALIGKLNVLSLAMASKTDSVNPEKMLTESIATARRISHDLSPPLLDETSLTEWINEMTAPLKGTYTIELSTSQALQTKVPKNIKLQLIRILQECINNTIKHANATILSFSLRITKKYIALKVKDNGKGFNTKSPFRGLGLKNMELRIQLLKGNYRLESTIHKGTELFILIKLPKQ
jgi:signal transduction histidine kinase